MEKHLQIRQITNNNKKEIFILGDSMVKNVNGRSISEKLKKKHNVYVRSFSDSKVRCMKDCVKLCIRVNDPDHRILHVGTNDMNLQKLVQLCSISIIDLGKSLERKRRGKVREKLLFVELYLVMMKGIIKLQNLTNLK